MRESKNNCWQWIVPGAILTGAAYLFIIRPWHLRWGTSGQEADRPLPGDEQIPDPMWQATRAVTIQAAPRQVWPWLVQLGLKRGGFYSYDRLDNAGIPSATEIIPELQNLAVGDEIPLDSNVALPVTTLEPERALVMAGRDYSVELGLSVDMGLAFILEPVEPEQTRLIARIRGNIRPGLLAWVYAYLFFEPVDFLMMRKQLLGIKQRAEALARS